MVETTRRGVERSVAGWREWIHLPELGLDPLVLEVNSSPGLRGIEAARGLDVAGRIIEFIEREGAPNRTRTRGRG